MDLEIDIEGFVESTSCDMRSQPLQGELSVLRSTKRIQSVVLRLNRIESIGALSLPRLIFATSIR